MIFKPWDCAQPDEWLPQSLRLCWGDSGSGGMGDGGGFGGATTGGGDWGSAGAADFSGMNAGGDLGAWTGSQYDSASYTGGGGGDWGSFGATNYSGMNAPNPTFADVAGPNPGVTTGGGDWGSAGVSSFAGIGGGGGGGFYGGGGGGGTFGDYGGGGGGDAYGGGGGYYGGGGQQGGGGSFGSFGTGTLGGSNAVAAAPTGPSGSAFADSYGAGSLAGPAGQASSGAPTTSEAQEDSAGPSEGVDPGGEQTGGAQFGAPAQTEDAPSQDAPAQDEAAPEVSSTITGGRETNFDYGPQAAPAEQDAAPSVFGPETVASQEGRQALSDLTQSALAPADVNWGAVFDAPSDPAYQNDRSEGPMGPIAEPGWFESLTEGLPGANPAWTQNSPTLTEAMQPGGPLSGLGKAYDFLTTTLPGALNPYDWSTYGPTAYALDQQAAGEQGKAGANPDATPWGSVFEGAAPALEGIDPGTEQYGIEARTPTVETFIPAPSETDFEYGPQGINPGAEQYWSPATEQSDPAQQAASDAAAGTAARGGDPAQQADAAAAAALGKGATQEQANAIGRAVYEAAVSQAPVTMVDRGVETPVSITGKDAWQALTQDPSAYPAINLPNVNVTPPPATLPSAIPTDESGRPTETTESRPAETMESGRPAEQQQEAPPQQTEQTQPQEAQPAPPSLIEQAQTAPPTQVQPAQPPGLVTMLPPPALTPPFQPPGAPSSETRPAETPAEPGQPDDHDAPEPQDTSQPPQDPNAPRPPENIPGQVTGARGQYTNSNLDNPRVNSNYRDSGRTDYPQGRPGIDFRTARQAGIEPLFRIDDINVRDVDARLVERINRAMQDMPANLRGGLVASSGWRPAHRGEAHEHAMDERTSQESVYTRYNPNGRNVGPAARPGGSNHGPGRAIDFHPGPALSWLRAHAREYGLETLGGNFDIPHIQLQGARGNAGARPSAQEQAEQRAIDAQNRQLAQDRGLIAPGRGNQQAVVPTPRARPTDAPQPQVAQPQPPAEIPVALPPQPLQETRPPADIPAPAPRGPNEFDIPVTAPVRNATVIANNIIQQSTAKLNTNSGQAEFNAAGVVAARALAAAGIPLAMAQSLMTQSAYRGAEKVGYGPSSMGWPLYKSSIDSGIAAALQGYHPARPGEVQGPPAPAAPGRQGALQFDTRFLAKGGHVAKDETVVVGEEGPETFIPDEPGTVVPHQPQPGKTGKSENIDRWPKIPAPKFPGRYGGVEREILRQTREAQNPVPSLIDLVDSGRLPLNEANWHAMLNDPSLIALGRSRMDDRREGINPGAEQYGTEQPGAVLPVGTYIPTPAPAADPTNPLAQALGYGSIKRRPMQIGRQSY